MEKNYNCGRKKLQLPEYGRHIHEMVDYLSTIEDRAERNRQANAVIGVMGNLFPLLRDTADYTHKLWDHMFIMADFHLDVDSPYPIPSAATLAPKPERMHYPSKKIAIKHYGKNVERMLRSLEGVGDAAAVEEAIGNIARYMRAKSYEYNQEHPNNEMIIKDIKRMSGNAVTVDEAAICSLKSEYRPHYSGRTYSKSGSGSNGSGHQQNGHQSARQTNKNGKAGRRRVGSD